MLLKKFNLILVLTFFCNNLCAASTTAKPLELTFQKLLDAISVPNNADEISRIIQTCDTPIALLSRLTPEQSYVPDEKNRARLNQELRTLRAELRSFMKTLPGVAYDACRIGGTYLILPKIISEIES